MIQCYFDNQNEINLSHIDQVKNVRPYEYFVKRNTHPELEFVCSKNYDYPGIYFIEVSRHSYDWCTDEHQDSFKILDNIPIHVIEATKQKKLRIVIISVVEGDSFTSKYDCYRYLTESFDKLELPSKSVLIVSGNLKAKEQYNKWCRQNNLKPTLEFIEGIEWVGEAWKKQYDPIFYKSIKNRAKLFNSLNRAHRSHRTDHLYFLAKNNLLSRGIVSGGSFFDTNLESLNPTFLDESSETYSKTLKTQYPIEADVSTEELRTAHLAGKSNLCIFENTFLTVSTETFFEDPGMFITEKTFRPIAMGHPFIILGQVGILKKLQSFGFKTDFIDTSYDDVIDHKKRFAMFHESFLNWINDDKEKYYNKWLSMVEYNLYIYKQLNFRKKYLDEVISNTKKYFKESF